MYLLTAVYVHNCVLVHHNIHGMDVHLHIFIQLG